MKWELTTANQEIFLWPHFSSLFSLFSPHPSFSPFPIFLSLSSMTSKAPAMKPLDTICFHSTLVLCIRPCCAFNCMTGQGQFVSPRPSINSVQKPFPAGGTQPSSHWPRPLLSTRSYLCSCNDRNIHRQSHIWTTASHLQLMLQGQGWEVPVQCKHRLHLVQLNAISMHFILCFTVFSNLLNPSMLAASATFSVAHLAVHSSMCQPMDVWRYQPMPPPSPSPPLAPSAPLEHISFTQKKSL